MPALQAVDRKALAAAQRARLDQMRAAVTARRGREYTDQILGAPTAPGGPKLSPKERANNIVQANELGPTEGALVAQFGGDPRVLALVRGARKPPQTADIEIVQGAPVGGNGVEQIAAGTGGAPPKLVMKVANPGLLDHTSAGTVTVASALSQAPTAKGAPPAALPTLQVSSGAPKIEIDPDIAVRRQQDRPDAQRASFDAEVPGARGGREAAAAQVAAMRQQAREAQSRRGGMEMGGL